MRLCLSAALLTLICSLAACSNDARTADAASPPADAKAAGGFGGAGGADLSIEAIEPTSEAITVGYAGDDPADIARYILAAGAAGVISPDGKHIAMNWRITGEPQVWIIPVEGGQPKQLTFGNGITFFRWAPDSSAIVYGADNNGNEQESFSRISPDGKSEAEIMAAKQGAFRVFGDILPDGKSLLFASQERNGSDFDLYLSTPGAEPAIIAQGHLGTYVQSVSPDGAMAVVTESVGEDSDKLMLLDVRAKKLTVLSDPTPRASHGRGDFAWTPDSKGFYFSSNEGREFAALSFYDLSANKTTVVHEANYDMDNVALCGPGGRWLSWMTNEDGFYKLHIEERATGKSLPVPALPDGMLGVNCSLSSTKMSINAIGWNTPGDIYVYDIATAKLVKVFAASMAGLDAERLVKPISLHMKAQDGVELQGLLYMPDAKSIKGGVKPPVVFQVHGGPTGQSAANFDAAAQYYVDRGIAVFKPNVRGSIGFGRTFVTLDDQRKRLDSVRDLVDMLAFLKKDGRVDADRAAVMGGSYGGYMVNAVVSAYPDAFKAGVSIFGIGNWVTGLEVASPGLKAQDLIEYGDIGDQQWKNFYTEISPVNNAGKIKIPMLYAHGVNDPRVDIGETEVMVKALRKNGIDTTFIRFADEGHGWRKLKNRLFYYRREAEFLEKHLAPA